MSELIIHSRITPPKLQANIVQRLRLTNLLHSNINKSLILISAPAGYGKTTLVQEFIEYHLNYPAGSRVYVTGNIKYAWLQLSQDIKSFYTFINYLIYSVKQTKPDFGENTLQLLDSIKERAPSKGRKTSTLSGYGHTRLRNGQSPKRSLHSAGLKTNINEIDEVIGTLINELYKSFTHNRLILVIDDFNTLDDINWINPAIDTLLELLPVNVTLILISRTKPGFNLTKLYAHRNIFELGSKELTFTYEEIKKLIENIYNLKYSDEVLKRLELRLEGWITGIHLAVQTYGNEIEKKLSTPPVRSGIADSLPDNIFNFFANEIFEKLDNQTQRFLLETSVLEHFDADICNNLLEITNSKNIINNLLTKNIFIQQVSEINPNIQSLSKRIFRNFIYQPSFSNFLQNKLCDTYQKQDIKNLYERVVNYYLSKKDYISAIHYSTISEDYPKAISLLKEHFQDLFADGKYELLWKCINSIDEGAVQKDAYLLYYKGLLYRYFMSDIESALKYIEDSISLFEKQKNRTFLINNYVIKAALLIHSGKTQEVIEDLLRLSEVKTTPANKALLLYYLGYAYYINTQYDEAIKYLNESIDICQKNKLPNVLFDIFNVLGNIFLNRGDFIKSTYYFEQNYEKITNTTSYPLNEPGLRPLAGIDKKFLTICNLIDLYAQSGKYEKAKQFLDKGYDIISNFTVPIFELILTISEARLKFEIGDYEETIRTSEKLNLLSKKFNRRYHIYLSYRLLAASYRYLNKPDKAREYMNLAGIYINEANKFQTTEFEFAEKNLTFSISNVSNGYLETLKSACSFFDENNFLYDKVQIYYYLAEYYLSRRNYINALEYTKELFKISSGKEYVSFLEREFRQSREVFDFALKNNINADFINRITVSNLEKINTGWLSEDCKSRLRRESDSIYDIEMYSLGTVDFKVRGNIIPEHKWKRKMRKLILAYLLLNRKKKLTKEKIIEIFFQNSPADSADNIFHQSVSNIRMAVIPSGAKTHVKLPDNIKSDKENEYAVPSYILYEDKILKLNPLYIYYIDAEEFNELYERINSSNTNTEMRIVLSKKLIDLYKGELLPGYYYDWCEDLRNTYLNKFIKTSEQLLELLKQNKLFEEIILYAEKLLKFDKLNDSAYINLIEAYIELENFSRANDTYKIMKKNYDTEFEGKPPKEVFAKAEKLLYSGLKTTEI
jgi:ATP/maltotriose-dependent transcriptional regulator MalT/DNA-binding SARP family transcriptional activator